MFGAKVEVKVGRVKPRVIDDNDSVRRVTEVPLHMELDDETAAGLGDVARDALKHLKSGAQANAVIVMDACQLACDFEAGEKNKLRLTDAVGVRAVCKKQSKEGASPTVVLTLSFATKRDELWWFVQQQDALVGVTMQKKQTEMAV